jgi:4-hydroxybenzoate polyprenyltransferase
VVLLAHLINHLKDYRGDVINKKSIISIETDANYLIYSLWFIFGIAVITLGLYANNLAITLFWILSLLISQSYSAIFMKHGWQGIFSISIGYVIYLYYGLFLGGSNNINELIAYSFLLLIYLVGTTPLKDVGDEKGDKMIGKITPAIMHGRNIFKILSKVLMVGVIVGAYLTYTFSTFWYAYLPITLVSLVSAAALYFSKKKEWGIVFLLRMYLITIGQLWIAFILIVS